MWDQVAVVATLAAVTAAASLLGVALAGRPAYVRCPSKRPITTARVFVFQGTALVDATPGAEEILAQAVREGSTEWERMASHVSTHFPEFREKISGLTHEADLSLMSSAGDQRLVASAIGSRVRISITDLQPNRQVVTIDPLSYEAMQSELQSIRTSSAEFPFLSWRQNSAGKLTWANRAYLNEAGAAWQSDPLFDPADLADLDGEASGIRARSRKGAGRKDAGRWYECYVAPLDDDRIFYAVPIDSTIRAEQQLRDFMQTLTRTFSHLTTGLAIFDHKRRLILFNPALTDLTGLPVDFLAARPTLYGFLDRLRERRMIPEPKDYGSWRRKIAQLESQSLDGRYAETWSLPDSRTYRVTGRPHHGGALALLFDDISSEVTMTRRFRTELELGQAVIDAVDAAIAVFSASGDLVMVNQAFDTLWETDAVSRLTNPSVVDLADRWNRRARSPVWDDIRDMVLHLRARIAREDEVYVPDLGLLRCRTVPVGGGSTLVSFRVPQNEGDDAMPEKLLT